jgi:hypothetical protein
VNRCAHARRTPQNIAPVDDNQQAAQCAHDSIRLIQGLQRLQGKPFVVRDFFR